jgi:hypothetical protein
MTNPHSSPTVVTGAKQACDLLPLHSCLLHLSNLGCWCCLPAAPQIIAPQPCAWRTWPCTVCRPGGLSMQDRSQEDCWAGQVLLQDAMEHVMVGCAVPSFTGP